MPRPLILITNDDGVHAPGLRHLIESVKQFGDVMAVAPAHPQSGQSSAITCDGILRVGCHDSFEGAEVLSVTGTPADCVKLALHSLVPRRPDILLSGINHGSNSGNSVIYSGTMGAVIEGCMNGLPSVGFSLLHHSIAADFSHTTPFIRDITQKVLAGRLPQEVCLNVNIPAKCTPLGVKVVRAARGYWEQEYRRYEDPHGRPFYMLAGHFVNIDSGDDTTDEYWLERKYVTVVPVRPDQSDKAAITAVENLLGCS